jgi:hypothetical protein
MYEASVGNGMRHIVAPGGLPAAAGIAPDAAKGRTPCRRLRQLE